MNIHEYQSKALLRAYQIPVPRGDVAFSVDDAVCVAESIGVFPCVVKAQVHAGGRGKAGGIKVAETFELVAEYSRSLLGSHLKTVQTDFEGQLVRCLLVEEALSVKSEFYVSLVVDRSQQMVVLMASASGGMDIESVADKEPGKICRFAVDSSRELAACNLELFVKEVGVSEHASDEMIRIMLNLYRLFWDKDASLVEINPLVLTTDGKFLALDAKISFDSNALVRQPEIAALRDVYQEDANELFAAEHGLSYVTLTGDIACLVNGAGLAMATMDVIKLFGGDPANFLDVGGGATVERVAEAFKIMLRQPNVSVVLVNVFGGILRCSIVAQGIIDAVQEVGLSVPLVVRMKGSDEEIGRRLLLDFGLNFVQADDMADAAQKAVSAAR